jgi:Na+/melibiose symporter-like transporter
MLGFPLDARRHTEIRRQLEARDSVAAAALVPAE